MLSVFKYRYVGIPTGMLDVNGEEMWSGDVIEIDGAEGILLYDEEEGEWRMGLKDYWNRNDPFYLSSYGRTVLVNEADEVRVLTPWQDKEGKNV